MAAIKRVGVIGAGQMGGGIAHVCALAGYEVLINDVARERIEDSLKIIDYNMSRQVSRGVVGELDKQEAFRVLKQTLNFDPQKIALARLKYDTFLDYYLCESHLECHRGFLRLDNYYVKVLTLKEPSAQSFPLIFKRLLEVEANYYVVTEWKKEEDRKSVV